LATINDIAKLAGVSHGTVSNVINRKGTVNTEKIRLVEEAIRRLGYHTNVQAQDLRKASSRRLALILPDIEQDVYRCFYKTLKAFAEADGYDTSFFLTGDSPEQEAESLKAALSYRPEYIVSFPCGEHTEAYKAAAARVVFVNNIDPLYGTHPAPALEKDQASFSFDFSAVSQAILDKIRRKNYKSAAFFFDSPQLPARRFLYESLDRGLRDMKVSLTPFFFGSQQMHHGAIAALEHQPTFDLVITHNPAYLESLRNAGELLGRPLPDMISFGLRETMRCPSYLCYELDYRELARMVWRHITETGREAGNFSQAFVIRPGGFREKKPLAPPRSGADISMLTVASPCARILSTLAPKLERSTGIRLKVIALPYEELFQFLSQGRFSSLDLIRIDTAWSSRMGKHLFAPFPAQDERIKRIISSFLPSIRETHLSAGAAISTLPLDPSVQTFFYRRDIFENPTLRRLYYEKTRKQLGVPRDYRSYNQAAAFFTAGLNGQSPVRYGATMVYGTAIVAADDFLPRLRSEAGGYFDKAGSIDVASPGIKKALEDYLEMKRYASPDIMYWWNDAIRSFTSGLSAMTIVFVNHASDIIRINDAGLSARIGAAPVPGQRPLLGGGVIGIARQSKKTEACLDFFNWVYSEETANMIGFLGGLSPVASVFENEEILEIYPWLRNMDSQFQQGWRSLESPLYPHFDTYQFESILGSAVRNAALGLAPVDEALAAAQEECARAALNGEA